MHHGGAWANTAGRLAGKVAIVMGGGSRSDGVGTGGATAELFAREGAHVVVADRDCAAAQRTTDRIVAAGHAAIAAHTDAASVADCERMVAEVLTRWGRVDVLVNNVGVASRGTVVDTDESVWDDLIDANVKATVAASRAAIPAMAKLGSGAIVNISSIAALRPRGLTAYTTTKAAVIALTQAMAVDHGPQGIRVNCVLPGPLFTPMAGAGSMSEAARERRREASVLGIEGNARDVGHAALYLASDEARYVTGIVLPVEGGALLRGPERDAS